MQTNWIIVGGLISRYATRANNKTKHVDKRKSRKTRERERKKKEC